MGDGAGGDAAFVSVTRVEGLRAEDLRAYAGAVACSVIGVLNPRGHGVPTLRETLRIRVSYDVAVDGHASRTGFCMISLLAVTVFV